MPKLHNVVLFGVLIVISGLLHQPPKPPLHQAPDLTTLFADEVPSLSGLRHPDWNRPGTQTASKDWGEGLRDLRAQWDSHPFEWRKSATNLPRWNSETFKIRIGTQAAGKDWTEGLRDLRAQLDSHPVEFRSHPLEVWKKIATNLPRWNSETFKMRMTLPVWAQPVSAAGLRQELSRVATNEAANRPGPDTDWSGLLARAAAKKPSAEWLRDAGPQWQNRPIGLPMAPRLSTL
jgi:hypothetical protein